MSFGHRAPRMADALWRCCCLRRHTSLSRTLITHHYSHPLQPTFSAMTSNFSPTEFLPITDRAWNLYRHCYIVSHTSAPQQFHLLLPRLTSLSQSIQLLQVESQDTTSTLLTSGPDWVHTVKGIVRRVDTTLVEIEKYANRCERLGDKSRGIRATMWDLFKVAVDGEKLLKLRKKVVGRSIHFHILHGSRLCSTTTWWICYCSHAGREFGYCFDVLA